MSKPLRAKHPTLKISQIQNASLDNAVIAPEETHTVVTEKIVLPEGDTTSLNAILDEINSLYKLQYCYCSVYGKCWFVKSNKEIEQSNTCEFRADIR